MTNDNAKPPAGPSFGIAWNLFLTGLALVLITLKLTGHLAAPWWLVLAPVWLPFAWWCFVLILGAVLIQASRLFKGPP